MSYAQGATIRVTFTVKDQDNIAFDPDFVSFEISVPNVDSWLNREYGDGSVTRVSKGVYRTEIVVDMVGTYRVWCRARSNTDPQALTKTAFEVE